ncbi:MAG: radical SAM family heme chaperone HemW, partial [Desulfobacteraceae bacterium]|nr:radical SAM family heme chaperone HemW [Desulfobacteraceae bacterium]
MSKKSIYIHIPFCVKKCFYCDFYSVDNQSLNSDPVRTDYTKALTNEIKLKSGSDTDLDPKIDTIYFGGGTPSTLSINLIEQILSALYKNFKIDKASEITMEINPGTIDKEYLSNLNSLGVNRLNIGVQSFQDDILKFLGRIHSAKQAQKAIEYSRDAGFKNLGIDLIYGIPNQDEKKWIKDLTKAVFFNLEHLSCYMLTFEKDTPLYNKLKQGLITAVSKESLSSFLIKTSNFLTEKGYIHYEISNFSSSIETMSKHNSKYWDQSPYIGFGASAHSFDGETRSWNHSDIRKYITDLEEKKLPIAGKEALTKEQKKIEMIML